MVCIAVTRSPVPEERPGVGKKRAHRPADGAAAGDAGGHAAGCAAGRVGPAGEGGDEPPSWEPELERVPLLSARETEVFELLGKGCSNRSIARELNITERTVKLHVARVLSKLRVESRLQAGLVAHSYRHLYQSAIPRRMNAR
ncbi:response regulator transcription factor [Streptomyces sp. NPDC088116]|uniref:response regulator transcription factor n=1 Tax=Streptomyces sp. NPDC088116 TaxID=3365825 RepID=UPI003800F42B